MNSSRVLESNLELSGPQIHSHIKKKPYTQLIKQIEFTYSILSKKQKTFVLTNDRFLYLKGIQSIGYARNLSQKTILPFRDQYQIPKPKFIYSISAIQSCTTDNQILKIRFSFDKDAYWQFVCPSKVCSMEWRKKIEMAIQRFKQFNNSKYQKYSDYVRDKEILANKTPSRQLMNSQTSALTLSKLQKQQQIPIYEANRIQHLNNFNNNNNNNFNNNNSTNSSNQNFEKGLSKSKSQLNVNTSDIILVKVPDNSQNEIIEGSRQIDKNMNKKVKQDYKFEGIGQLIIDNKNNNNNKLILNDNKIEQKDHHFSFKLQQQNNKTITPIKLILQQNLNKNDKSNNTSPTPITHNKLQQQILPQQLSKIQQIFLQKSFSESASQNYLNKSFSNISINGRQQIRSQIISLKRQWIDELISKQQQSQLMLDYKKYCKKIIQILVNQLHINNQKKIFPYKQWNNQYVSYIIDDVYIQIYFFTEEQIQYKHKRYQKMIKQFKNYDYFLETTQNQYLIFPPLMALFQYKGCVGMVKTIISDNNKLKNQQFYKKFDRLQFQNQSRINSQILLNQSKCHIISYNQNNYLSRLHLQQQQIYFINKLQEFLPQEKNQNYLSNKLLRPQLIQDQQLDHYVLGLKGKDINTFQLQAILQSKVNTFVKAIENQQEYFTNSQELSQIIHSFGLNIRHLGLILKRATHLWFKQQIKAQLAARSLKNLFRFDLQNCILNQIERMNTKQKQLQRQIKRVISFLNVVLGNGQATIRIWRSINNYSLKYYGSLIWQQNYTNINIKYFLQAIQYHFKILLNESIHQKIYFQSMKSLDERQFIKFISDIKIYNLDYTQAYQQINQCLQQISKQNFHKLCSLIIKQTRSKKTYLQIIKGQSIYQKINSFLLEFISPQDNIDFYNKLQHGNRPNRFIYQSKLAQIKWNLKANRLQGISRQVKFIQENVKKWLGPNHFILIQLNRILTQYYSQHKGFYPNAVKLATATIEMQNILFGGETEAVWKDYFLLAKIHYSHQKWQQALPALIKAKKLINLQNISSFQHYAQLLIYLSKSYKYGRMLKQSYLTIRQLYNALKQQGSQFLLEYLLQSVLLMKDLLESNQQYESYYRFIETDFAHVLVFFANNPDLIKQVIQKIFVPYLKSIIFLKSKNRGKAISAIEQISHLSPSSLSCMIFLQQRIRQKKFPYFYLQFLKEIDVIIDEIYKNQLIQKWISLYRMSNDTLLQKIGGNQINRGFEFLADLSVIIGIVGNDLIRQLSLMQK